MKLLKRSDVLKCLSYDGSRDISSDRLISLLKDRVKAVPSIDTDDIKEDLIGEILSKSTPKERRYAFGYLLNLINNRIGE